MAALTWGAATDPGRIREENEDAFLADQMVFVVADGMGGHQAGEVASSLAVGILRERLGGGAPSPDVVVAAVVEANAHIFQTAHTNAAQRGMGTTLTAMAVLPPTDGRPEQLAIVNVGDSRCYLRRGGVLVRTTVDHSYVQELLATGHITEQEARNHPRRNIVTRALGIEPTVRVDSWMMPVVRGDRYVLCSDGLVDEIEDAEILHVINLHTDPQGAAEALVAAAVAAGGRDNVTVVVVDVVDGVDPGAVPDDALDEFDETASTLVLADPEPAAVASNLPPPTHVQKLEQRIERRLTARTFLLMLLGAVVLTVLITLLAVALTNDDPAPDPPVTTITVTTADTATTEATEPSPTTTERRTTTTVRSTTTSPAAVTTLP